MIYEKKYWLHFLTLQESMHYHDSYSTISANCDFIVSHLLINNFKSKAITIISKLFTAKSHLMCYWGPILSEEGEIKWLIELTGDLWGKHRH